MLTFAWRTNFVAFEKAIENLVEFIARFRCNSTIMIVTLLLVVSILSIVYVNGQTVEEFHAHGPTEFHDLALNKFMEMRKANPEINLNHDSPFLEQATRHAIRRGMRKADESFELKVYTCNDSWLLFFNNRLNYLFYVVLLT